MDCALYVTVMFCPECLFFCNSIARVYWILIYPQSLCVPTSPSPSSSYPFLTLSLYALNTFFGLLSTCTQETPIQCSLQNSPNILLTFLLSAKGSTTHDQRKLDNNFSAKLRLPSELTIQTECGGVCL